MFSAAYALKDGTELSSAAAATLSGLLRWFEENLEQPERFNRSKSKGYYRRPTKGISWFKPGASEHISKAFELSEILREHGHHVEMRKSRRPGYVVYEDSHQIVAEPFSETNC